MTIRAAADAAPHLGFHFLAPARPSGALPMELEALLPNRRHNDELMVQLQPSLGEAGAQGNAIAAVFAADPFINVREMASALARVGVERVANFPRWRNTAKRSSNRFRKSALASNASLRSSPSSASSASRPT